MVLYQTREYPTKKAKYSGKLVPYCGAYLVYLPDGTVITVTEIIAGVVKGDYETCPEELEFYVLRENDGKG